MFFHCETLMAHKLAQSIPTPSSLIVELGDYIDCGINRELSLNIVMLIHNLNNHDVVTSQCILARARVHNIYIYILRRVSYSRIPL